MSDITFREKIEKSSDSPMPKPSPLSTGNDVHIEVPYLDYTHEHSRPFIADAYNLGNTWDDPEGGFPKEVTAIENYIREKISSGEIANSIADVKNLIQGMEKLNNLSKESRAVVKLEILSNYVEFMQKNANLKSKLRRYANP